MDRHKVHITIDHSKCAPCSGLTCVGVCPQGILTPGNNGKPEVVEQDACTRCEVCANLCPTKAITIYHTRQSKQ